MIYSNSFAHFFSVPRAQAKPSQAKWNRNDSGYQAVDVAHCQPLAVCRSMRSKKKRKSSEKKNVRIEWNDAQNGNFFQGHQAALALATRKSTFSRRTEIIKWDLGFLLSNFRTKQIQLANFINYIRSRAALIHFFFRSSRWILQDEKYDHPLSSYSV